MYLSKWNEGLSCQVLFLFLLPFLFPVWAVLMSLSYSLPSHCTLIDGLISHSNSRHAPVQRKRMVLFHERRTEIDMLPSHSINLCEQRHDTQDLEKYIWKTCYVKRDNDNDLECALLLL